eukprot:GHVH01007744.1.p2 GENE.GHVH01007744.1~~GHVH01007744.1.p2  ORF type:complete len:109 (+),score=14.92 GHVH01007744.1:126-452(+)
MGCDGNPVFSCRSMEVLGVEEASPDVVTLPLSNYFTNEGSTIWKLSNSWVSRSWSQRVMKIDGKYLRYFVIGSTSSYWEEEPRAELNLCGAKVLIFFMRKLVGHLGSF